MNDRRPRPRAAPNNRTRRRASGSPDRIALWAVLMAVATMLAAAVSSAEGANGGVAAPTAGDGGSEKASECDRSRLGKRKLRLGDCGRDVRTLNWILNSKRYAKRAPLGKSFKRRTDRAVARFQRRKGLDQDGIADRRTTRKLVRTMRRDVATWYGPGFFGNRTACGQRLRRKTVGVAHKRLPCGTKVTIRYQGRFLRTRVIDRGPYAHGAKWDLTERAAKKLRFIHTDKVRSAIVK